MLIQRLFVLLLGGMLCVNGCSGDPGDTEAEADEAAGEANAESNLGESSQELLAAPLSPLDPASIPNGAVSLNGTRGSRYVVEPHVWLTCTGRTTATCTTQSGGLGAACGVGALCNPDLQCISGFCQAPEGLNGVCQSNANCGVYGGTQLVCVQGKCLQKSGLGGRCDEPNDCQLPAGSGSPICVANECRVLGDVGAPCEGPTHCKTTSSTGVPLVCYLAPGATLGVCQGLSGLGGVCTTETHCNQSTAPRCTPTATTARTCNIPGGEDAWCDDKPDCNQATAPTGRECIASHCKSNGGVGTGCTSNTNCIVGLACIQGQCNSLSGPGGPCDDGLDCTQSQPQRCIGSVCRVSGVLNGPCGTGNFCSSNTACVRTNNPSGAMVCISDVCQCPATDSCTQNSDCAPTITGEQSVCVPRISPATGKVCRPAGTTPTGCCDEKADCRPLGASACTPGLTNLGCNSGGECTSGSAQGVPCATSEECIGSLVCKINTLVLFRNYTTCEY